MKIDLGFLRDFVFFLIVLYVLIGGFSLIAVAMGEDIPFMPFWHWPLKFLFNFLFN